jgi:RNA polymerase sigma factor (sigma-70 family)
MRDSEMVAAVVAGDPDGLAAAYDRYAAPLHGFCASLLTERADASDAVQDTFIVAATKLAGLRDRDLLKPWLYAVARNECHRRLRTLTGTTSLEAGDVTDDTVDFGVDLERAELREVVGAVIAGLNPGEREVIELSLRQDFSGDDLASALGVSRNQAHALAARAGGQFETSLGTLLVARTGRSSCARLDELLDGWDGQLTALLRKRLNRHIQHCRACSGRKHRELQPAMMLSLLPMVAIARGLRQQVLGLVASSSPDIVAYRARVVQRAEPFGESGFPVPIDPLEPVHRFRRPALAVAAAAAFVLLCAVGIWAGLSHDHSPRVAAASLGSQPLSPQATAASSGLSPAARTSSRAAHSKGGATHHATPTTSASATVSVSVSPSATSTARPSPSRSPSRSPSSKPTPTPTSGALSAAPTGVTLGVSPGGGDPTGTFTLTASGGSVAYSITVPAVYAQDLTVSPSTGSLAAGQSVEITVTWQSTAELQTDLTIGPGGPPVSVSYQPPGAGQGAGRRIG